jgi:hypothetical protein
MIEALRKQNPTWGRWPIWLTLRKEGFALSERTVGRILAYLEGHGRVESVAAPGEEREDEDPRGPMRGDTR